MNYFKCYFGLDQHHRISWVAMMPTLSSLVGGIRVCHHDNHWCIQPQHIWHHDDSLFSVMAYNEKYGVMISSWQICFRYQTCVIFHIKFTWVFSQGSNNNNKSALVQAMAWQQIQQTMNETGTFSCFFIVGNMVKLCYHFLPFRHCDCQICSNFGSYLKNVIPHTNALLQYP